MSGGADSAVGAVHLRQQGVEHVLVSHVGATNIAPIQRAVAREIRVALPDGGAQHHAQLSFTRRLRQPNGDKFRNETSTRTRSLLFLSLGLSVSSGNGAPLWIAENGFASLNPPLGADQRGSLSTRTTHPLFLAELSRIVSAAGAHAVVENPFEAQTKGEMFAGVAERLGNDSASRLLASSHSCSHTGQRSHHVPVGSQCGECFGCLVRRAAFAASGVHDPTDYLVHSPDSRVRGFVASHSMRRSMASFVEKGVSDRDIAAMTLPAGYTMAQARAVCDRAIAELRLVAS
jgi:7-cyano-7-deazaguanine synthase in queuosine biosynthesis